MAKTSTRPPVVRPSVYLQTKNVKKKQDVKAAAANPVKSSSLREAVINLDEEDGINTDEVLRFSETGTLETAETVTEVLDIIKDNKEYLFPFLEQYGVEFKKSYSIKRLVKLYLEGKAKANEGNQD